VLDRAADREAELALRLEPGRAEFVASVSEIVQHFQKIVPDKMFEHVAVVQGGAPAYRFAVKRRAPEFGDERPQQQLLRQAHARIGRHLE
jgi:hypothetical protein